MSQNWWLNFCTTSLEMYTWRFNCCLCTTCWAQNLWRKVSMIAQRTPRSFCGVLQWCQCCRSLVRKRVDCGAECPLDCRGRPCGCGRLYGYDIQSMSVRDNLAECARVHAGVQSVHATTQTRKMWVVRWIACSTPDQIHAHEEISQWVAPCLYKSCERLSSDELVLRLLEKCRHSLEWVLFP